jgi:hypothetical protein
VITGLLAVFCRSDQAHQFASEEAGFLNVFKQGSINIKGLLLAGMIVVFLVFG